MMYEITHRLLITAPSTNKGHKSIFSHITKDENGKDNYKESNLYFVECKVASIETNHENNNLDNVVTNIFMCFTEIDIFITVSGSGLTISGPW